MTNRLIALVLAALFAMSLAPLANVASATPVGDALAIKRCPNEYRDRAVARQSIHGRADAARWGPGFGAGLLGGAIIGGILAPYYAVPYYGPGYGGNAVSYCMQRFRSYDPGSGTYLGYDGYRHPCP